MKESPFGEFGRKRVSFLDEKTEIIEYERWIEQKQ